MVYTVLNWDGESDGDATHVPTIGGMTRADANAERSFRHKLAQQLVKDLGNFVIGKSGPDGFFDATSYPCVLRLPGLSRSAEQTNEQARIFVFVL